MALTPITLALAETKTLQKRIEEKQNFILQYLTRQSIRVDPLAKEGGSEVAVSQAMQSIRDLQSRLLTIRHKITEANQKTMVTVEGVTMTVTDWLNWKREVAPYRQLLLKGMRQKIDQNRSWSQNTSKVPGQENTLDIVVTYSEIKLAEEIENLEKTLGTLDGQLSLVNAVVQVDI